MKETKVIAMNIPQNTTLVNTRKDQDKPKQLTREARRALERDTKKRVKKAGKLYERWIQAKEKGDPEEIAKVEKEIKELNKKK